MNDVLKHTSKLLAIGAQDRNGKHVGGLQSHARSSADTGFATWALGMLIAALPLFFPPFFRFITGACDIRAMFAAAFSSSAMLYVGITMAVTSINDVNRAGAGPAARAYHSVCLVLLVIGLLVYGAVALAPEVGRSVDADLQLLVNAVYVLIEFLVGCVGYVLIGRN